MRRKKSAVGEEDNILATVTQMPETAALQKVFSFKISSRASSVAKFPPIWAKLSLLLGCHPETQRIMEKNWQIFQKLATLV
jgi:hypothetical protein